MFLEILRKQLLLKGIITQKDWDEWKNDIIVNYVTDGHFMELKEAEVLRERLQTLDQAQQYVGEFMSKEWVMKNILKLSDEDIKSMKKDMASEIESGEVEDEDGEEQEEPQQQEEATIVDPEIELTETVNRFLTQKLGE